MSSLGVQDEVTLEGHVSRAAEAGVLTIVGNSGAVAPSVAHYELTGSRGTARLDLAAGESLYDAADRINQLTAATGVSAVVQADNLVLSGTHLGSSSTVQLRLLDPPAASVDGVNAAQVAAFTVLSQSPGTSQVIAGTVVSSADRARLVYTGTTGGTVAGTATFRLTGTRGAVQVALTQGESLDGVADRINQHTAATGVVASISGNELRLSSDQFGAGATVQIDSVERQELVSTSGVDSNQISDFTVVSIGGGSEAVLSGQVLRTASQAEVTLAGTSGGTVVDTATFELTGTLGSASVSINQGESLSAVAARVNGLTHSTGVVAHVDADKLVFRSSDAGSAANVAVQLTDITHTTTVSGVDAQQLTSFQVESITEGASDTLSGTINKTAGIAELSFSGIAIGSLVGTTATFTLSGSQGSAQISVSTTETLSTLANRVNQQTSVTGVQAVVVGSQVKFRSMGVGSSATVAISVTSGSFNVSGGNGNGTANGTNATATVNGQAITGTGNTFRFTDAVGTYSFTAKSGFTGSFSAVSIVSQAGDFDLAGGNGDGTASGLDALAEINGVQLTGVANRFTVSDSGGEFQLEFAGGYQGAFSPVTVRSTPAAFDVQGGDATGTATGSDFEAIINGVQFSGTNNRAVVAGENGTYAIEFADSFQGNFDAISVTREGSGAAVQVLGGDGSGRAQGVDAVATINGTERTGSGSTFAFTDDGAQVTIEFRPGFTGVFDPVTLERGETPDNTPAAAPPPASAATAPLTSRSQHYESIKQIISEIDRLLATDGTGQKTKSMSTSEVALLHQRAGVQAAFAEGEIFAQYPREYQRVPGSAQVVRRLVDFLA